MTEVRDFNRINADECKEKVSKGPSDVSFAVLDTNFRSVLYSDSNVARNADFEKLQMNFSQR